jgi:hypothetical protein
LITPAAENNPIYGELLNRINQIQNIDQVVSELAVLRSQIDGLAQALGGGGSDEFAVLQSQINGLALTPAMPEVQPLEFGSFYRTDAAIATAINTAQTVAFQSQSVSRGIEWLSATPTRIYVYAPGEYNFQFSAQMTKTSANLGYAWIWPALNGTDVPNSATRVSFQGSNSDTVPAWNWFLAMKAGDYFELKWAVDNLDTTLAAYAAPAFGPAIPSVILTANRVSL